MNLNAIYGKGPHGLTPLDHVESEEAQRMRRERYLSVAPLSQDQHDQTRLDRARRLAANGLEVEEIELRLEAWNAWKKNNPWWAVSAVGIAGFAAYYLMRGRKS